MISELSLADRLRNVFEKAPDSRDSVVACVFGITPRQVAQHRRKYREDTGDEAMHHGGKADQIHRILRDRKGLTIYETNGELGKTGKPGVCTQAYASHGVTTSMMNKDGDIMHTTYRALLAGVKYDVLDIDPYSWPMEPIAAGILNICKPSSTVFLTWSPVRYPVARSKALRLAGTSNLTPEARDAFVKNEAVRAGFVAVKLDEAKFNRTVRQAWQLRMVKVEFRYAKMEHVEAMEKAIKDNAA